MFIYIIPTDKIKNKSKRVILHFQFEYPMQRLQFEHEQSTDANAQKKVKPSSPAGSLSFQTRKKIKNVKCMLWEIIQIVLHAFICDQAHCN